MNSAAGFRRQVFCHGLLAAALCLAGACTQRMADQPRYDTYEASAFFPDGLSARPLPDGVVSRSSADDAGPPALTMEALRRGQERFNVYCAPCHGYTGDGDGIIVMRGLRTPPPSFHSEKIRSLDPPRLVEVIRNGEGAMPSYAYQTQPADRWAIAQYVKALQLSQWADVGKLSSEDLERIGKDAQ